MRKTSLQCPFCENYLSRPVDITLGSLEITGGICTCGAVFVFDRTGRNLGAAFMDALNFACREDYDRALSLMPEEYETQTLDYDPFSHTACISESRSLRKIPKLLFVKLKTGTK